MYWCRLLEVRHILWNLGQGIFPKKSVLSCQHRNREKQEGQRHKECPKESVRPMERGW